MSYAALAFDDFKAELNLQCAREPRTNWVWNKGCWWGPEYGFQ